MIKIFQIKKIIAVGIIFIFIYMNIPLASSTITNPESKGYIFTKLYCFGTIDNITFNEHLLDIQVRNLLCTQYIATSESKFLNYFHLKEGYEIQYYDNFTFHGVLKPHFINGYFFNNHSSKNFLTDGIFNQRTNRLGLYFDREFFIGSIKNLDINGSNYSFDAVNIWRFEIWWDHGSRGIGIDHAKTDTTYYRFDYAFRGILKSDFICAIGRNIWKN